MINRLPRTLTMTAAVALSALLTAASAQSQTAEPYAVTITLKDHRFSPSELTVPGGRPVRVELINRDSTADEIDGDDLGWDTKVPPHGKVMLPLVAPLKPGTYKFTAELHPKTAQGTLTVAAPAAP